MKNLMAGGLLLFLLASLGCQKKVVVQIPTLQTEEKFRAEQNEKIILRLLEICDPQNKGFLGFIWNRDPDMNGKFRECPLELAAVQKRLAELGHEPDDRIQKMYDLYNRSSERKD